MRLHAIMLVASILSVSPTHSAQAQARDVDSTTFRAGQWGAEFLLGAIADGPSGAGALRFLSASHALLLDVSGGVSRQTGNAPVKQKHASLNVRTGSRWYRPVTHHVLQYLTLGALVSVEHTKLESVNAPPGTSSESTTKGIGAGAFAELGASWSITPQLSLGASWQGNVRYARNTQRTVNVGNTFPGTEERRFNLIDASIGLLSLRAAVYF